MSGPVTVLHVIDSLGHGGAQGVVESLACHRDKTRFAVTVATLHGHGVYADRLMGAGIPVVSFADSRTNPLLAVRLVRYIQQHRPRIVHCHLAVSTALVEWLRPLLPKGTIVVSTLHSVTARSADYRYQNILERLIYRRVDRLIAISGGVVRSLRASHGSAHAPVMRIPNGIPDALLTGRIDADRAAVRRSLGTADDTPVLLSAGRLILQKNVGYCIDLLKLLSERSAVLWIAGSGSQETPLRDQARRLGVADRVQFLGYRNDLPQVFSAADYFLFPSRDEGQGLVVIEAMAKGAIAVLTPFPVARELVRSNLTGLVIPFDDAATAAARLDSLMGSSDANRERLRANALAFARRHFSASQMTAAVEAVYTELLQP